ncbi:MAG: DUF1489 family protein [Kiloniellales bacterium]
MARKTTKAAPKRAANAPKRARKPAKGASKSPKRARARKAKAAAKTRNTARSERASNAIVVARPGAQPTLHLIKLSVGTDDVADLRRWQRARLAKTGKLWHRTRMLPKRAEELLAGGSIYWVIRGMIRARQRLTAIERVADRAGRPDTHLMLDSKVVPVLPTPYRAFQGWRYLLPKDAPADLARDAGDLAEMPPKMLAELRQLGLV